jgi:DUF1680 family protein
LYCAEQVDQTVPVTSLAVRPERAWHVRPGAGVLGVHRMLVSDGFSVATPADALYAPWRVDQGQPCQLTLIPYHLWANREPGAMSVWLPIHR